MVKTRNLWSSSPHLGHLGHGYFREHNDRIERQGKIAIFRLGSSIATALQLS